VGVPIGTPGCMAPEQIRGEPDAIGPATDVYALGTILFECLTSQRPFQEAKAWSALYQIVEKPPRPPSEIRPEIPASLDRICLKCLAKDPGKRYPDAEQLAQAIERFLSGADSSAAEDRPAEQKPTSLVQAPARPLKSLWYRLGGWLSRS
jgi:eukaryotic-like serine/threonine-protein kinase